MVLGFSRLMNDNAMLLCFAYFGHTIFFFQQMLIMRYLLLYLHCVPLFRSRVNEASAEQTKN